VVPALAGLLKDDDVAVRRAAAGALREYGPEARGAVAALKAVLDDADKGVRHYAQKALRHIEK
jgi:HEAT repeat protein